MQLVFVFAVVGGAVLLSASLGSAPAAIVPPKPVVQASVSVILPEPSSYRPDLKLTATVEPATVIDLVPQVSGEIIDVSPSFRSGARVNQGDLLFAIDPSDYELAIERTLADIQIAKSDLVRLEAEAASEKQVWLSSRPNQDVPDLIARVPQIAAAKARIRAGEAAREAARLSLRRTRVFAPFDARVIDTQLDIGQVVSAAASVGSIYSIENLEVIAPVSSDDLKRIGDPVGRVAIIESGHLADQEYIGQVVRQGATLDQFTRLGKLFIRTEAVDELIAGEFVNVTVKADAIDSALEIPQSSLRSRDQVWVVDSGVLSRRQVQILGQRQDRVVVQAFDAADGVVITPPAGAREGQQVILRQPAPGAGSEVSDAAG